MRITGSTRYLLLLVAFAALWNASEISAETTSDKKNENKETPTIDASGDASKVGESFNPIPLTESLKKSLHEDAQKAREEYWKKTLEEISSIGLSNSTTTSSTTTSSTTTSTKKEGTRPKTITRAYSDRWKRFSSGEEAKSPQDKPERYNGFISWERLLQEWSEDIQEYLDEIEDGGNAQGYPMSTFGKMKKKSDDLTTTISSSNGGSSTDDKMASKKESKNTESVASPQQPTTLIAAEPIIDVVALEEPIEAVASEAAAILVNISDTPPTTTANKANTISQAITMSTSTSTNSDSKVPRPIPAPRKEGEGVLPHTDISDKSKRIWIVTTASLPWMTGTAVNPLLRAAYMSEGRKQEGGTVTLMLPWLERKEDQDAVYGEGKSFDSQEQQEEYVRGWLKNSAKMEDASEELEIRWYTAWQNKAENSLYSMGDIVADISIDEVDIIVLEEPEHLNWYRAPGESWTNKFKHVVGIVHTNYFVYAQEQPGALVRAPAMKLLCTWMCRSHCHRLIKLSGTLGQYAPEKELIENVHGVRGAFLDAGVELRQKLLSPEAETDPVFSPTAEPAVYFIGKMLWSKGIGSLMELLKYAEETANIKLHVDMYGGGPDKVAAEEKAQKMGVDMSFLGPIDHPELATSHKVFINPSTSEVLCTTVAEALAMGKFVVLPSHPSNDFFTQFPNCLPYASKEEFVGNLYYALTHSPEPLSEEFSYALSWKAATARFEDAGCIPEDEAAQYVKWVGSGTSGIDITLPPLIENKKGRKLVADTLEKSRADFRKFRDTLSQDIGASKVLPKAMRDSIVKELDKRLDFDIDELLTSPKLNVKLSPAELDKQCIELYEYIAKGPSGDILRIIGGGQEVAMQHRYMKRQAIKKLQSGEGMKITTPFFFNGNATVGEKEGTASQRISWTMRRNLQASSNRPSHFSLPKPKESTTMAKEKEENNMKMSLMQPGQRRSHLQSSASSWTGVAVPPPSRLLTNARMLSSQRSARGLSLLI